jgi:hypothetical protein
MLTQVVFPKAIAILIPTLATVYCLPFAVSMSVDPQTRHFEVGRKAGAEGSLPPVQIRQADKAVQAGSAMCDVL